MTDQVDSLNKIYLILRKSGYWIALLCDITIILVSIFVLIRVYKVHKRTDWFLLSIPTLFFIDELCCITYDFDMAVGRAYAIKQWEFNLIPIANFCYFMAHWLFPSQYLRTSLLFPKLFTQARLEWL